MKKLLLTLLGALLALPAFARDFEYTYEGQTLTYTVIDEAAKTVKTKAGLDENGDRNTSGVLIIPSTVINNGISYTVTSIGDFAFWGCTGLTSVEIPNSVTSIGYGAFESCSGLTSVTIPNSVTEIGGSAFEDCSGLTSVIIPPSVTSIGNEVFYNCYRLKKVAYPNTLWNPFLNDEISIAYNPHNSIIEDGWIYGPAKKEILFVPLSFEGEYTLPEIVTSIGEYAFSGCSGLTGFIVGNDNDSYASENGVLYSKDMTLLIQYPAGRDQQEFEIPNSVTKIASAAFSYSAGLNSVIIPNSVIKIDNYAFRGCNGLTSLTIEDGETTLSLGYNERGGHPSKISGSGLFISCPLETIYLGRNLNYEIYIWDAFSPFSNQQKLRTITIGDKVTSIGDYAFSGCSGITAIEVKAIVPPTVLSFYQVYDSAVVTIPRESADLYLTSSWTAFKNLRISGSETNFEDFTDGALNYYLIPAIDAEDKNLAVVKPGNYSGEITIPERFTYTDSVGNNTRYYVSGIGYKAFTGCDISRVNFNSRINLKYIGDYAFERCTKLSEFSIPSTVTKIGSYAFSGCSGLKKAEFSSIEQLCSIEFGYMANPICFVHNLFINGEEIKDLAIPNSVTKIGNYSFHGCSGLTSVIIPNSVTKIGGSAFNGCTGLTLVAIPNSVTEIGSSAFYGCIGLTSVTIGNSVKSIRGYAFQNCTGLKSVSIPNSVTSIGNYTFSGCSGLTSIVIPNSVTTIGSSAFYRCSGLTSVTIPNSVTSIENYAFQNCTGLKSIAFTDADKAIEIGREAIPSNITSLYWGRPLEYMNFDVKNLNSLTIGNETYAVPDNCFKDLNNLKTLKLGSNITKIGANAFSGCSGLTEAVLPSMVETIGNSAFAGNSGVKSIIMGANVKAIGDNAFNGCPAENVYITAQVPPTAPNNTFSRYTAKLWLQDPGDNSVIDAYYDAFTCWDRFDSYAMIPATDITTEGEPIVAGKPGDKIQLTATVAPANTTLPHIFWRSTNPEVATVDVTGLVTILATAESESRAAGEPCKIIAETLYADGPTLEFTVNSSEIVNIKEVNVELNSTNANGVSAVYNLRGVKVGESTEGLPKGIYIVREGSTTRKIAI